MPSVSLKRPPKLVQNSLHFSHQQSAQLSMKGIKARPDKHNLQTEPGIFTLSKLHSCISIGSKVVQFLQQLLTLHIESRESGRQGNILCLRRVEATRAHFAVKLFINRLETRLQLQHATSSFVVHWPLFYYLNSQT